MFAVLVPAVNLVDFLSGFARKAAVSEVISTDMAAIENDYRKLWEQVYAGRVHDNEVRFESGLLLGGMTSATSRDVFGEGEEVNQRPQQEVYRAEALRYAS